MNWFTDLTVLCKTALLSTLLMVALPSAGAQCQNPTGLANGGASYSYWAKGTTVNIFVGAGFTDAEVSEIANAVSAWASASGLTANQITLASPIVGTLPPPGAQNAISFVQNPSASPDNFAYTNEQVFQDSQGNNTNRLANATVNLNKGFFTTVHMCNTTLQGRMQPGSLLRQWSTK